MTGCPGEDSILAFVEHRLDLGAMTDLQHHLATCAACRRVVSEVAKALSHSGTADTVDWRARTALGDAPVALESLARGASVARYLIVSQLGRGGMGVVYRAYDPDLNRQVALKLVALRDLDDTTRDQARQRLLREAQALAQLSHPNVVAVHDVGTVGDDVFIAMELVEGKTLRAWLREQPRSVREILRVFRLAGEGLAAAHKVGVIHRDFKPDNVMVGNDGRVRVLDFGLARVVAASRASRSSLATITTSSELTQAGVVMGTPAYMSPEQDAGLEVGAASDQFSFCVALFEALYDSGPHAGTTYRELAHSRAAGEVAPPPKRNGVSSRIRRAVLVGLRPAPEDRHRSLGALIAELESRRWTSPRSIAIAALGALVVGATGTWAIARGTAGEPTPSCGFVAEQAAKVWNPAHRAELVAALSHANATQATALATRLDRWTADWVTARTAVCEAPHHHAHATNDAEQLQCLDGRLQQLDAMTTVFRGWQAPEATRIDEIARQLGAVEDCRTGGMVDPTDAEKEASAPVIQVAMQTRLAIRNGKLDEALDLATRGVAMARGTKVAGAIAMGLKGLAEAHTVRGELADARKAYREFAVAAAEAHSDEMVADAWLGLIHTAFQDRRVDDDVKVAMFAARVAVARLPESSDRIPQFHFVIGSVQLLLGKLDDGIAELEQAIAGWNHLGSQINAGDIAQAQNSLGVAYMLHGDWDTARTNLTAAWDGMVRVFGLMQAPITAAKRNLALLELAQEHYVEAERIALEALAIATKANPVSLPAGEAELQVANIESRTHGCAAALRHAANARRILERLQGHDAPLLALVDLSEARCATAPRAAIAQLTRARQNAIAHPAALDEIAEIDFALAQALDRAGDHRRARATAAAARDEFSALGAGTVLRVRAIDKWLGRSP